MTALLSPDECCTTSSELPCDPRSVREARGFVRRHLTTWGLADLVDDASLVVTEMATNAVVHAHSPYTVTAQRYAAGVRLEVRDGGHADDREVSARGWTSDRPGGRGLALVAALTRDWGVLADGDGKTVWAELAA